jgi:type I restriction enzyme S subunit
LKKYLLAPFEGVCSSEIWVLKGIDVSNNFLYRIIQTDKFIDLANQSSGSKMPRADWNVVENGIFSFCTLPEQTRIASFFTVLDKKITELKQKKNLLEQFKKGVMQKLFSQELRFKDENGKAFSKWEKKKLNYLADIKKGEQLNKEELTEVGSYPCINGGITQSGYTEKFNSLENTITISEGGNSCGYVNYFTSKFWSGGHCYTLKVIDEKLTNNEFLFQLLKQNEVEIKRLRVGSGLPNIQKKDLLAFSLTLPPSINEQIKISNFLSSIDEKINHTENQIQQTQQYKKGLLQNMFI